MNIFKYFRNLYWYVLRRDEAYENLYAIHKTINYLAKQLSNYAYEHIHDKGYKEVEGYAIKIERLSR